MNPRLLPVALAASLCALPLAQASPVEEAAQAAQYRILAGFEETPAGAKIRFAVEVSVSQNEPAGITGFAVYRQTFTEGTVPDVEPSGEEERLGEVANLGFGRLYEFADSSYEQTSTYLYVVRAVYGDHDSATVSNPVGNWPPCQWINPEVEPPGLESRFDCLMPLPVLGFPPCSPVEVSTTPPYYEWDPSCLEP
jgi:hypothetical protein